MVAAPLLYCTVQCYPSPLRVTSPSCILYCTAHSTLPPYSNSNDNTVHFSGYPLEANTVLAKETSRNTNISSVITVHYIRLVK